MSLPVRVGAAASFTVEEDAPLSPRPLQPPHPRDRACWRNHLPSSDRSPAGKQQSGTLQWLGPASPSEGKVGSSKKGVLQVTSSMSPTFQSSPKAFDLVQWALGGGREAGASQAWQWSREVWWARGPPGPVMKVWSRPVRGSFWNPASGLACLLPWLQNPKGRLALPSAAAPHCCGLGVRPSPPPAMSSIHLFPPSPMQRTGPLPPSGTFCGSLLPERR